MDSRLQRLKLVDDLIDKGTKEIDLYTLGLEDTIGRRALRMFIRPAADEIERLAKEEDHLRKVAQEWFDKFQQAERERDELLKFKEAWDRAGKWADETLKKVTWE